MHKDRGPAPAGAVFPPAGGTLLPTRSLTSAVVLAGLLQLPVAKSCAAPPAFVHRTISDAVGHIQIADLDGDGRNDLVSIDWDQHKFLHVWRNDAIPPRPAGR